MRIGLVVDSSCDLPQDFIREHGIEILPVTIRLGDDEIVDRHDELAALEFYRSQIGERGAAAESVPFSAEQIGELFLGRMVSVYDYVFCETVARSRSAIFENATKASFTILSTYREAREASGKDTPFAMRVLNTGTLFTGQGVIAAESARLIAEGLPVNELRTRIDALLPNVWARAVPQDVYYLRARARKKGDRSVGLLSAALASTLDIKPIIEGRGDETRTVAKVRGFDTAAESLLTEARQQVEQGLLAPFVGLSYAGDLNLMRMLPGYEELHDTCAKAGVQLLESVMSVTGGVNLGPGTLTVGLLAKTA